MRLIVTRLTIRWQVYVLKDTWRDERRALEGELLEMIGDCEGVAQLHSYCSVTIDGQTDTTHSLIRRDLVVADTPRSIETNQEQTKPSAEAPNYRPNSPDGERSGTTRYLPDQDFLPPLALEQGLPPLRKVHSRLVVRTYGWPIKYALSPAELLCVVADAVRGHKNSYSRDILHRDVSEGNILVMPVMVNGKRVFKGVLIDYDNAIKFSTHQTLADDPASGTRPFMSGELLQQWPYFVKPGEMSAPRHDAIHDLESFLWVLVYICLSRDGPAHRRREIWDNSKETQLLRDNWRALFEGENLLLAERKQTLIRNRDDFAFRVLRFLPVYYKPLEEVLRKLRDILETAYRSREFNNVHEDFIEAMEAARLGLEPITDPKHIALQEREIERRRTDDGRTGEISPTSKGMNMGTAASGSTASHGLQEPESPTPKRTKSTSDMLELPSAR
ncbi:uncharacterized protein FIBRA_08891 [Fibroporia radiculosa]|uniref:Protein kinase domain-containing protein n=1 Tax=Fibroporia radiculosa TaxID=599839 RepID=J4I3H1_9APHY|nr:uncharacterized protein FIBRA_08891 [Fibroporia radiculosa]CCM06612.1 predicted protein [Fibroporia radiculosa]